MNSKSINILYWVFTLLFSGLMIFSAVPNIITNQASVQLMHDFLGYPVYIIAFIGVAKLIGSVIILIPGWTGSKNGLMPVCFLTWLGRCIPVWRQPAALTSGCLAC
jgi:hypothetical protein